MTTVIALAQVNSSANLQDNLNKAMQLIEEAHHAGAQLIAFPESFLLIGEQESDYLEVAEPVDGPLVSQFCAIARSKGISILLGGFCEKHPSDPQKTFNTSVLIDEAGKVQGAYRKIHLFDSRMKEVPLKESKSVAAGDSLVCVDQEIGRLGLSICYDLRFPNLYQRLRTAGAQVIFIPAAFTYQTGEYHWVSLLRARAIETQSYIVAPAQVGWHNAVRRSFGHSLLIDPWGEIIADGGPSEEGLVLGEIDLEKVRTVREEMPLFEHRVPGIDLTS